MKVYVDGDIVAYSCGFAVETSGYNTEDGIYHSSMKNAKDLLLPNIRSYKFFLQVLGYRSPARMQYLGVSTYVS